MAKNTNTSIKTPKIYIGAAVSFAIILLLSIFALRFVYKSRADASDKTMASMNAVQNINSELISINKNLVMVITNMGDTEVLSKDILNSFSNIEHYIEIYEEIGNQSEMSLNRFNSAKLYINAFHEKVMKYENHLRDYSATEIKNIYVQEIAPYQTSSIEMFESAMNISERENQEQISRTVLIYRATLFVMFGFLIVGEAAIIVAGKMAKKAKEELERKARQAAAVEKKFKHSQEKVSDIALRNILTGTKNRYALEEDISERLANDQFNIAVFDMDNFKSVNDIYGYDFGDEYLSQIAEKLKSEFGEVAEIYNITGNEFCFVFNRDVSDLQALKYAENILAVLTSPYNVANIVIQLTASGSTYHYLPGDCISLNALLVKMDNTVRNAKRNGGNAIFNVMGI